MQQQLLHGSSLFADALLASHVKAFSSQFEGAWHDAGLEAILHIYSVAREWWPPKAAARADQHLLQVSLYAQALKSQHSQGQWNNCIVIVALWLQACNRVASFAGVKISMISKAHASGAVRRSV